MDPVGVSNDLARRPPNPRPVPTPVSQNGRVKVSDLGGDARQPAARRERGRCAFYLDLPRHRYYFLRSRERGAILRSRTHVRGAL